MLYDMALLFTDCLVYYNLSQFFFFFFFFFFLFSLPEPLDSRDGLILQAGSLMGVYVCMSKFSNIFFFFFFETTGPIEAKVHMEPLWDGGTKGQTVLVT